MKGIGAGSTRSIRNRKWPWLAPLTIAITAATLVTGNSQAVEYIDAQSPAADSARVLYGPLAHTFRARPKLVRKALTSWKKRVEIGRAHV